MDPRRTIPPRLLALGGVAILAAIAAFILIPRGGASGNPSSYPSATTTGTHVSTTTSATQTERPSEATEGTGKLVGTAAIERALVESPVVVVAAYQPDAVVDTETAAEARAGARTAGAGYIGLDVSDERQARNLTTLLQEVQSPSAVALSSTALPSTPAVLVFRRPRALVISFHGFVDRQIVAQAASLVAGRSGGAAWQLRANAICRSSSDALAGLALQSSASATPASATGRLEKAIAVARRALAQLRRVHPPVASTARFQAALALDAQALGEAGNMLTALRKSDNDAFMKAATSLTEIESRASQAFVELGLSACV